MEDKKSTQFHICIRRINANYTKVENGNLIRVLKYSIKIDKIRKLQSSSIPHTKKAQRFAVPFIILKKEKINSSFYTLHLVR
jgi:hypothetical protein